MKVAIAAPHGNFMVAGGANVQLTQTMKHLPEFDISVEYFNPWKLYHKENLDLVHIFDAGPTMYDLALRLRDLKTPFVTSTIFYTLHQPWFLQFSQIIEKWSKKIFKGIWTDYGILASICEASQAVFPNTSAEAHLIEKGFRIPAQQIHIIPNGVEERFYHADPAPFIKKYGIRDFILNVSNLGSLRKNTLSLIRALQNIDHPAVIIGKIYQNKYAEQCLQEAQKNKNLLIINALAHDSVMLEAAYAASHVFVLPAYFETPGIAAMEAALTNSNIVITPHGGTKDYFQDQAIYVNPKIPTSISQGIEASLNQQSDGKLRERIYQKYLWKTIAQQTAIAYHQVVKGL